MRHPRAFWADLLSNAPHGQPFPRPMRAEILTDLLRDFSRAGIVALGLYAPQWFRLGAASAIVQSIDLPCPLLRIPADGARGLPRLLRDPSRGGTEYRGGFISTPIIVARFWARYTAAGICPDTC